MGKTEITLLALLTLAALTIYSLNNKTQHNNEFQQWKGRYAKSYSSSEESYRLGIWLKNVEIVQNHNRRYQAGLQTYQMAVNQFADLPSEQFGAKYLNKLSKPSITKKCNGPQAPTDNLPDSLDWATKGSVTPVKNQGNCGSCWAFSAVGSLQGAYYNQNKKLLSFSEQQLVDCSKAYGNEGCNGGDMPWAFWYVIDNGITTEDKYPYTAKTQSCKYTSSMKVWQIKDCTQVTPNKELSLKASINLNPVAVSVDAGGSGFQFYSSGIFSGKCGTKLNHGVLATGYGSKDGKGYWIIKNSWASSWGMKGYIWLSQNGDGKGECGINMQNSYPNA